MTGAVVGAAICPQAPFLVDGASGATDPAPQVRDAVRRVSTWLAELASAHHDPDIVVVGLGRTTGERPVDAAFSAARLRGTREASSVVLPTALGLGRQVLREVGTEATRLLEVAPGTDRDTLVHLGRGIGEGPRPVLLLVLADGSACRTEKAPGYLDSRAAPFDAALEQALAEGNSDALLDIDPDLASAVRCEGRETLQVLAGAVGTSTVSADLIHSSAPFGVCYLAATWAVTTP